MTTAPMVLVPGPRCLARRLGVGRSRRRDVIYVDLPTGHWPMWSRPVDLAIIGDVAKAHSSGAYLPVRAQDNRECCDA